jgi:tetratricopeptide (TPR) repeat protein
MNTIDAATGMQLAQMGRFTDALPYLERAHLAAPSDLPLLHAVASLLQSTGRGADAVARYRHSAARLPENAEVLTGWARALLLIGEQLQAIALLESALALEPRFAVSGGMLDMLLTEFDDADISCALLRPLVARHPRRADLLLQYARALTMAEYMDEAEETYRLYSALQPLDPLPHVEIARLAINRSDPARARASLQSALAISPDNAPALWEVSQLGGGQLDQATLDRVQTLVRSEHDPWRLSPLHDVLARHYDRIGEYATAAAHVVQANAMQAVLVPPQQRYRPAVREREIDAAVVSFTPAVFQRLQNAGSADRRPVFIIGMPRSGTTLLQQMLTSHPAIVSVGEQTTASASFKRALIGAGRIPMERMTPQRVGDAAGWHLQMLQDRIRRLSLQADAQRIIDKLPDNYTLAGWLAIAFPNAAIIHCLRDPRDVALSCWRTQFSRLPWCFDLDHIAHRIEQHRRLMRYWRTTIGGHLTELRYEHLITDPETVLRRILSSMGLDWHPDVLAFSQGNGFVRSASQYQVRQPLNPRGIGHWRHYETALQSILPRLTAVVEQDARELTLSGNLA